MCRICIICRIFKICRIWMCKNLRSLNQNQVSTRGPVQAIWSCFRCGVQRSFFQMWYQRSFLGVAFILRTVLDVVLVIIFRGLLLSLVSRFLRFRVLRQEARYLYSLVFFMKSKQPCLALGSRNLKWTTNSSNMRATLHPITEINILKSKIRSLLYFRQ